MTVAANVLGPFVAVVGAGPVRRRARRFTRAGLLAIVLQSCVVSAYGDSGLDTWGLYRVSAEALDAATTSDGTVATPDTGLAPQRDPYDYFTRQLDYAANPPTSPDEAGLWSDTKYFFAYQVLFIGVLYVLPESVTSWSEEQKTRDHFGAWRENIQEIAWDTDDDAVNYIGHPYFGSTYYTRARERGYGRSGAFWYAAGLSAAFEFGAEAFFEPPSIQDLITTPVLGGLLGYWFEDVRNNIRQEALATGKFSGTDKFILAATDLLGYLNSYADRVLGKSSAAVSAQISVTPPVEVAGPLANLSARDMPLGLWLQVKF